MKREIAMTLAGGNYYPDDEEKHDYIKRKYAELTMPMEEAEWIGLDINEACRKQQDIEDNLAPVPQKYLFEKELIEKLSKDEDLLTQEEEYVPKKQKSMFAEKYMGRIMKPLEERLSRR